MSTTQTLTSDDRQELLNAAVAKEARHGWSIQSQSATQASLVKGKPTSHLLHLILTIITLGLWAIVWILVAVLGGQKTKVLTVDQQGRVTASG